MSAKTIKARKKIRFSDFDRFIVENLQISFDEIIEQETISNIITSISKIRRLVKLHIKVFESEMLNRIISEMFLIDPKVKIIIESKFKIDAYEYFNLRMHFKSFTFKLNN